MIELKFTKDNSKYIKRYVCGIYAIRNNLNGKMYIGSSTNIRSRYEAHFRGLCNNSGINKKLQEDFNKIGYANFSFLIVEECSDNISTLRYLESKYIQEYGYYNCCCVDGQKVYCYDKNGNLVTEFNSIKEAARKLNALADNIRACCNGRKKSCSGFQWSYKKVLNLGKYAIKEYNGKSCKSVCQYDKNGKFLNRYDSIREASRVTNIPRQNISSCLCKKNNRKYAGGYIWKHEEEKL